MLMRSLHLSVTPAKAKGVNDWKKCGPYAALAMCMLLYTSVSAAANPPRVMSLHLCGDVMLALLADRAQIASVSYNGLDPAFSPVADLLAGLPTNRGRAEEVIAAGPDLVLVDAFTQPATKLALRRLGVRVLELAGPTDFDAIAAQTQLVAHAIGQDARGAQAVAQMRATLAAVEPPAKRPLAAILHPGGWTEGPGTLADAALVAAGYDNLAAREGLTGYAPQRLETLIAAPLDLLLADVAIDSGAPSLSRELLAHPALAMRFARTRHAKLPSRALTCGTPRAADAVAALASLRAE
jgi:iron complex transport system substrate-binding protein